MEYRRSLGSGFPVPLSDAVRSLGVSALAESSSLALVSTIRPGDAQERVQHTVPHLVERSAVAREETLDIALLGRFAVSLGTRKIEEPEWPLRKVRSLVKLLALSAGHRMVREQVMELLWPELEPDAAANNLHKALHIARRVFEPDLGRKEPSSYLRLQGDVVSLESPAGLWIDAEGFREAAFAARLQRDPILYMDALRLYTGDLLPEDRYEDWAARQREELRALHLDLLVESAGLWEAQGEIGVAIDILRQVVARETAHEEAHARLMRLLVVAGHRHLALRQYEHLREALHRELDAEPAQRTQELQRQIRRGEFSTEVVEERPRTEYAGRHVDRKGSPPLVGRSAEMAACNPVLQDFFSRRGGLMLVYGEAGMGKSRLAAELAERVGGLGATVLWGASYAMESAPPYGPLIVALEGFAIRMTRAGLHALLGDSAEELARLVPAIGTSLGSMAPAPLEAMDRRRLYSAMGQFFRRFAERSPVLLVLDDLQAADDATLDLAQYLARTLQDVPFLILGLVRTQGKRPDKRIASLAPVTRAVSLSPLNLDDIHRLVASVLSGSVSDDVPRVINTVARGNPFYVLEAIDAMAGRGYITNVEGVWCMNQHNQAPHERLQVRRGEGH